MLKRRVARKGKITEKNTTQMEYDFVNGVNEVVRSKGRTVFG